MLFFIQKPVKQTEFEVSYADFEIEVLAENLDTLWEIDFLPDNRMIFNNLGRIREVVEHKVYLHISTSNKDGRGIPRINDDKIIRTKLG